MSFLALQAFELFRSRQCDQRVPAGVITCTIKFRFAETLSHIVRQHIEISSVAGENTCNGVFWLRIGILRDGNTNIGEKVWSKSFTCLNDTIIFIKNSVLEIPLVNTIALKIEKETTQKNNFPYKKNGYTSKESCKKTIR